MLLLVTIGLVVVGAIALVIGFVSNSLAPIYLSIACSVIAGIVLVVFSRIARRGDTGTSAAPAQASPGSWAPSTASAPPPPAPVPAPAMAPSYEPPAAPAPAPWAPTTGPAPARSTPIGRRPAPRPEPEPEMEPEFEAEPTIVLDKAVPGGSGPDADGFPIAGYETMRSSQIIAMLADLDLDELDMVQEHEEQGKNRATVLRRVVERIDQLEADEDVDEAPIEDEDEDEDEDDVLEPAAVAEDVPAADDDDFPIADYDSLSAEEIIAILDDLEDDELDLVAEREETGQNRAEILDYIDDMFEEVDDAPEPPAPRVVTPPASRAAAKRPPAKKAVAVKKAPVEVAATRAPAKRAAAAPAGRKAAAVVKAPPRKAVAAKAPAAARGAVASPGTKSAGRRSAAPVAKAAKTPAKVASRAVVKKTAVKKAATTTRKR